METKSILSEALDITSHGRQEDYGNPEDNFSVIADYWSVYLTQKHGTVTLVNRKDVAMMMSLLKTAREGNMHKRDNLVDACGYLRCASVIEGDESC